MLSCFSFLTLCPVLPLAPSQCPPSDDLCPAGEFDKQVEPGTGRPREALPPSSYTSQCLGPDADRERREGEVTPTGTSFCLLRSLKASVFQAIEWDFLLVKEIDVSSTWVLFTISLCVLAFRPWSLKICSVTLLCATKFP